MTAPTVAVLGAGMSGAVCAWALGRAGLAVTVFEMGRGAGGRMATRRTREHPALRFNHGAPAFAISNPSLSPLLEELKEAGVLTSWTCTVGKLCSQTLVFSDVQEKPQFVGCPGMSSICDKLIEGAGRQFEVMLTSFERRGQQWLLGDKQGTEVGPFDWLVVSSHTVAHPRWTQLHGSPPPLRAAVDTLASPAATAMADAMAAVAATPRMVAMLAFEANPCWDALPTDIVEVASSPTLVKWVRQAPRTPFVLFVLHSTPDFARKHLNVIGSSGTAARMGVAGDAAAEGEVAQLMYAAFQGCIKPWVPEAPPLFWGPTLHRWANCFPEPSAVVAPMVAPEVQLACCGDHLGLAAGTVEAAALSGLRAAEAVLTHCQHGRL